MMKSHHIVHDTILFLFTSLYADLRTHSKKRRGGLSEKML